MTHEWIKKLQYVCIIHVYNGIYARMKDQIMQFSSAWMELKHVLLSEVTQRKTSARCSYLSAVHKITKQEIRRHEYG